MRVLSALLAGPLAGILLLLSACGPIVIPRSLTEEERVVAQESKARRDNVETVAQWFLGEFSSQVQSQADPNYRDLRIRTARVWDDRQDGVWMYSELFAAETPETPLRQRVYRFFVQPNGLIVIEVLVIPKDASRYVGAWNSTGRLSDLSPKSLEYRSGCEYVLKQVSDTQWTGGTVGNTCQSDRTDTAYVATELRVTPEGFTMWERGYDDKGKLLWGPTKGPYDFRRE